MDNQSLLSLAGEMRKIAAASGPQHGWWDVIFDMEAHANGQPGIARRETAEWLEYGRGLLRDEFSRKGRTWTVRQGSSREERYQVAGPTKGQKPPWNEAPDWAKYLMCDPLMYYWSDCWEPANYRVEPRPSQNPI